MGFISLIPLMLALIGVVIAIIVGVGISLVVIGGTGIAMNGIYKKQMQVKNNVFVSLHNVISMVVGIILILLPVGYLLFNIISGIMLARHYF